jgi:hypothetical protein
VGNARSKTSIKWPHRSKKGPISASKVGHGPYDIFIYAIITGPVKPDGNKKQKATQEKGGSNNEQRSDFAHNDSLRLFD